MRIWKDGTPVQRKWHELSEMQNDTMEIKAEKRTLDTDHLSISKERMLTPHCQKKEESPELPKIKGEPTEVKME